MLRFDLAALLVILAIAALTSPARGQEPKRARVLVVFEIENRGAPLSEEELVSLTEYLSTKLGEQGDYQIVPRSEIRTRLLEQKTDSYKECYDQQCQIEIGRELAAEMTVSTRIGKIGERCILTAVLYDLKKAASERTASESVECTPEALLDALSRAASKLQLDPTVAPIIRPVGERKSVLLAVFLSFLPGGGMYYTGKWGWGLFYTLTITSGMVMLPVGFVSQDSSSAGVPLIIVGAIFFYGGVIVSAVHAGVSASDWRPPGEHTLDDVSSLLPVPSHADVFPSSWSFVFPILTLKFE